MTTMGDSARAALAELALDVETLQRACRSILFSDDALVCENVVDAATRFLNVVAPSVLAQVDAGDLDAAKRLARAVDNIRSAVTGEASRSRTQLTFGGQAQRFFDEVITQTGVDVVKTAQSAFPFVAVAIGGLGLLALVSLLRR